MKLTIYFKLIPSLFLSKISLICVTFIGMLFFSCKHEEGYKDLKTPVAFSSNIPVDVNPVLQKELKEVGNIFELNQAYNFYSWQALIAINWPLDVKGNPKEHFYDKGTPAWIQWKEAFQVYRADGKKPAPWGSDRLASGLGLKPSLLLHKEARIILSNRTPTHTGKDKNVADETDQAFAGKLFDQNGNVVVYEVLMNEVEFDYVVQNKLYNINGQLNFTKTNTEADFPKGDYKQQQLGATEIKLAWKVLETTDHKERYYKNKGYLLNEATQKPDTVAVDLGLIGFHISQKTPTGKQWVWSTFEHVDNLDQNVKEVNGKTTVIHPTLTNPDCEICPANVDATNGGSNYAIHKTKKANYWTISGDTLNYYTDDTKKMKTQAKRMVDIPVRVKQINTLMQNYFKQQGSVWQYYQLIDTQYPIDQNAKPGISTATTYNIPKSVVNKPGGNPNLALLTNITMETFFQKGNQVAGLMENSNSASSGNTPVTIFGTESCIGCHSSAPIFNKFTPGIKDSLQQGTQLSGDFSWLLKRANWDKDLLKQTEIK